MLYIVIVTCKFSDFTRLRVSRFAQETCFLLLYYVVIIQINYILFTVFKQIKISFTRTQINTTFSRLIIKF